MAITLNVRLFLALLALSSFAIGNKDDSYYPNGITNPNVKRDMYWNDASNVLQDLSQFSELYVQFHSCAWSPFVGGNGERAENRDENDYWYMNAMPQYGPNVAYSLYGALEGDSFAGCTKKTYINSFYTTSGFPVFANALASGGLSNTGTEYSAYCSNGAGVTCSDNSGSSTFAMMSYSNGQCTAEYAQKSSIPTDLAEFNTLLKTDAKCAKIYSAGDSAPSVLTYSRACSLGDFVGACPDPHGKKSAYELKLMRLTVPSLYNRHLIMQGSVIIVAGVMLFVLAGLIVRQATRTYPLPTRSNRVRMFKSNRARSPKSARESRREKKSSSPKKAKKEKSPKSKKTAGRVDTHIIDVEVSMPYGQGKAATAAAAPPEDIYLAPLADDKEAEPKLAVSHDYEADAVDPPPSTSIFITRSPSFASARSNIEVQAQESYAFDEVDDDDEQFENEWGSKPKADSSRRNSRSNAPASGTDRKTSQFNSSDSQVGGPGAWLETSVEAEHISERRPELASQVPSSRSTDILLTPSFLNETDGDESDPESSRPKSNKIRRFIAKRRKHNQASSAM